MVRFAATRTSSVALSVFLRRQPDIDVVRIQDVSVAGERDQEVLEWSAGERRILLMRDVITLPRFAYQRVAAGQQTSGVFVVSSDVAIGEVIDDLVLLNVVSEQNEWDGRVLYLPLK